MTDEEQKLYDEYESEIVGLKNLLNQTDYVAIKIGEGAATEEEYSDIVAARKEWRAKINEAQAKQATLLGVQAETLAATYNIFNVNQ